MTKQTSSPTTESIANDDLCHWVQQWLPGYLRWELTAVQQQKIQTHLTHCDRCAQQVQEARLLTNDLQAEADRHQPRLSKDASLRIQQQVYRRMQRSLVWQRTGQVIRMGTAVVTLLVLLAGSFLFGRFWLDSEATLPGDTTTLPEETQPAPTAIPTAPPVSPTAQPVEETGDLLQGNGRLNAWDSWTTVTPGQSPEQLAHTIMAAALAHDTVTMHSLFVGLGAGQQPTAALWLRIGNRCQSGLSINDFQFIRRPIPLRNVTSVSIWYDYHLVGEIKMRQVQGEWFATFTRTPAVNPCLSK